MENYITKRKNEGTIFKQQTEERLGNSSFRIAQTDLTLPICVQAML